MSSLLSSIRAIVIFTIVCGGLYPLAITVIGNMAMRYQATGSIITKSGKRVGSELVQQPWPGAAYFDGRPSAGAYATVPSGASNLGPTSNVLRELIQQRRDSLAMREGVPEHHIPADLLTASGSGLDPHISPQAAYIQFRRVATERGLDSAQTQALRRLIHDHTEKRLFGFIGEERINVLKLNLALDSLFK